MIDSYFSVHHPVSNDQPLSREFQIIQIPGLVLARFEACLAANHISEKVWGHYKKWLRFYLDFCTRYQRDAVKTSGLAGFQQKLLEKGQTELQRKQAAHTVGLYLGIDRGSTGKKSYYSSSVPSLANSENLKTDLPVTCPSTQEPPAYKAPLISETPNAALMPIKKSMYLARPAVVSTGNVQPITGASWVAQLARLAEELEVRHYSPKTLKT